MAHLDNGFAVNSVPQENVRWKRKVAESAEVNVSTLLANALKSDQCGCRSAAEKFLGTILEGPRKQNKSGTAWSNVERRYVERASSFDIQVLV